MESVVKFKHAVSRCTTAALGPALLALAAGCVQRVEITLESVSPVTGADGIHVVGPTSFLTGSPSAIHSVKGEKVRVTLRSDKDLDALAASKQVHHAYALLLSCPSSGKGVELYDEPIYRSTARATTGAVGPERGDGHFEYSVYIPRIRMELEEGVRVVYPTNADEVLASVQSDGLCILVAGYTITGAGFRSNWLRLPIEFVDGRIEPE